MGDTLEMANLKNLSNASFVSGLKLLNKKSDLFNGEIWSTKLKI
jgi:hypothetical protein